jgi:hypothetical protein
VKQVIAIIFFSILISGCATTYRASKVSGWDQQQYHKDNYECRQDASRRVVDVYGKYGNSDVQVDKEMFFMCMRARGYTMDIQ